MNEVPLNVNWSSAWQEGNALAADEEVTLLLASRRLMAPAVAENVQTLAEGALPWQPIRAEKPALPHAVGITTSVCGVAL